MLFKTSILLFFGLGVLLIAIRRLRVYRLKERHALIFLLIGLPFLILAVWQDAIGWLAQRMGIAYQTLSLMCVSAFLLLMVFELLTIVSLQDRKISTLAQIVGIIMEKHGMSDRPGGQIPPVSTSTRQLPGEQDNVT
ncbi:MAG TPA: DUF2304 domain-containing protein [Tepidisphaeraceae bacterium]|nr:DUF2304 domain-containing protein [Tepidisphaeraceae bacterium]